MGFGRMKLCVFHDLFLGLGTNLKPACHAYALARKFLVVLLSHKYKFRFLRLNKFAESIMGYKDSGSMEFLSDTYIKTDKKYQS